MFPNLRRSPAAFTVAYYILHTSKPRYHIVHRYVLYRYFDTRMMRFRSRFHSAKRP